MGLLILFRIFLIYVLIKMSNKELYPIEREASKDEDLCKVTTRTGDVAPHFEIVTSETSVTERKDDLEKEFAILMFEKLVTNRRDTKEYNEDITECNIQHMLFCLNKCFFLFFIG